MTFLDKGLTQVDVDIGILILNLTGELVEVSAQYLVMTGFEKEEVLGKRIDDFGTGYSSLQRLKNLPIDTVKIDKCFVDNIEHCPEDVAIVMATSLLSKTFKVDLIAEGIETQEQADKLSDLGCFNQQGYLYSRPLRSHDFEVWLADFSLKSKDREILKVVNNS